MTLSNNVHGSLTQKQAARPLSHAWLASTCMYTILYSWIWRGVWIWVSLVRHSDLTYLLRSCVYCMNLGFEFDNLTHKFEFWYFFEHLPSPWFLLENVTLCSNLRWIARPPPPPPSSPRTAIQRKNKEGGNERRRTPSKMIIRHLGMRTPPKMMMIPNQLRLLLPALATRPPEIFLAQRLANFQTAQNGSGYTESIVNKLLELGKGRYFICIGLSYRDKEQRAAA